MDFLLGVVYNEKIVKRGMCVIKILLVEDDETICFGIRSALGKKGYEVIACAGIEEGKDFFSEEIRLILLDLNLPDGSGYEFCRWIRQAHDTPVIFLTVRDDAADITRGLDMGADDYITKPFHIAVMESRIQAVLRRVSAGDVSAAEASGEMTAGTDGSGRPDVLCCGDICLNRKRMLVYDGGEEISLTALEYRLLLMLMENKGCILPRGRILEKIWDADGSFVNDNTLTVAVKRLREKLNDTACITTVRGIGYRMEEKA